MSKQLTKQDLIDVLKPIENRLGTIETDVHTIKTVLQIDEQVENLRTVLDRRSTARDTAWHRPTRLHDARVKEDILPTDGAHAEWRLSDGLNGHA